jgi:acyl dehydratase
MNANPLLFNDQYSADTEFGQHLVNSTLTPAVVAGMSGAT